MKIAITGHTRGLGKACYLKFLPNALGFSRHNGYDIDLFENRRRIIENVKDCNVFINNAYTLQNSQLDLLYELYEDWSDKEKHIINIGSNSSTGTKSYPHKYSADKYALEKASEQLSNISSKCKVSLIKFGYINTDRVIKQYNPKDFLELSYAVEIVNFILNNKNIKSMEIVA